MKLRINIVFTYHNRKKKTTACLNSIFNQTGFDKYEVNIFACDDGSTDGTTEEIKQNWPTVNIVQGTGNLFWTRGMTAAMNFAEKTPCDYYLMINDDVKFYNNMLDIMVSSANLINDKMAAISGATIDPDTKEYSYGGAIVERRGVRITSKFVLPSMPLPTCNRANWNCFLLSQEAYSKVGKIDDFYQHGMADYDYSFRLLKEEGKIFISSDYIGECSRNSAANTWRDSNLGVKKRLELIKKPTGIPIKSSVHYYKKTLGLLFPIGVIAPYGIIFRDGVRSAFKRKG